MAGNVNAKDGRPDPPTSVPPIAYGCLALETSFAKGLSAWGARLPRAQPSGEAGREWVSWNTWKIPSVLTYGRG